MNGKTVTTVGKPTWKIDLNGSEMLECTRCKKHLVREPVYLQSWDPQGSGGESENIRIVTESRCVECFKHLSQL